MPMFDDPSKELKRLEEQLLAEEEYDELEGIEDLLADYEETDLADYFEEDAGEDEAYRRPAQRHLVGGEYDWAMSEMLLEEEDSKPAKKKKGKGVAGLVILCVLETAAIIGLLAWWYLCLR